MNFSVTNRRCFLTTFAATMAGASTLARGQVFGGTEGESSICFFVAGVRFQPVVGGLDAGSTVKIVRSVNGTSISVRTMTGELLGYVPRRLIAYVLNDQLALLRVADYDAVPWKRFQVEIGT